MNAHLIAWRVALVSYVIVGVFTFGHAFNHVDKTRPNWIDEQRYEKDGADLCFEALFSSIMWPLYWSTELQKVKP